MKLTTSRHGNAVAKGCLNCAHFQGRRADRITRFMFKMNIKSLSSLKQASSGGETHQPSRQTAIRRHTLLPQFCGDGVAL
jgi:hypothetical protein